MFNKLSLVYTSAGLLVGGGLGTLITYKVVVKKAAEKYEALFQEEHQATKRYYEARIRELESKTVKASPPSEVPWATARPLSTPVFVRDEETLPPAVSEALETYTGIVGEEGRSQDEYIGLTVKNVFKDAIVRTPDRPYLISHEEFLAEDAGDGWGNITLYYWEGDDTLSDDQENMVMDVDTIVGLQHLNMFGRESEDNDIVYVRNERLEVDYEIVRDERSFSVVVLGVDSDFVDGETDRRRYPKKRRDE